jgi:hypothetical protein
MAEARGDQSVKTSEQSKPFDLEMRVKSKVVLYILNGYAIAHL